MPAVMVTMSRTAANNNAVPLTFSKAVGIAAVDTKATAIAVLVDNAATNVTVPGIANLFLAGLPAGTSSPWGDTYANAAPYQVSGIAVVPGTWITVTNTGGLANILPGYLADYGPNGEAGRPLHHGENQDHTNFNIGPENGMADAIIPACALTGMFLNDNDPTGSTPPPTVDWTDPAVKDQPRYSTIPVQAPFLIGDGLTSGGRVKRFQVPPGATRLYLSAWDGVVQSNNSGSFTATINLKRSVRLVK